MTTLKLAMGNANTDNSWKEIIFDLAARNNLIISNVSTDTIRSVYQFVGGVAALTQFINFLLIDDITKINELINSFDQGVNNI